MSAWDEAVKTALLGTNRGELPQFAASKPLGQMLTRLNQPDDAATLLAIAGTAALHGQTGWLPPQTRLPTAPPSLPEQPVCPSHIATQLDDLLEGGQASLLPEMLEALAQTGHTLPDFFLPGLLNKGVRLAKLRPAILPLLGARGRWLASQNPDWRYAALEIESWAGLLQEWQTAVPNQCQSLLRQLRLTQPERGRQLLEHTWKSSSDALRTQFIKLLDINLTMADEPFLETALDDRNHLVRRAAADLLARLPESRLAQRVAQNLSGILTWTPTRPHAITVFLPTEYTPAMLRDGIPAIKPEEMKRLASRQISQIIGRIPLHFWTEQWHKTPAEIAQAVLRSAWPQTLTAALSTAAIRQNNEAWAITLITTNHFSPAMGRLIPVLSPESCFELMQQAATQSAELLKLNPLHLFLQHWHQPWTEEMSQFWLEHIGGHLQQNKEATPDPAVSNLLKKFAQQCAPTLAETAVTKLTTIPGLNSAWQKTVRDLCQTLQLRRSLLAEINHLNVDD